MLEGPPSVALRATERARKTDKKSSSRVQKLLREWHKPQPEHQLIILGLCPNMLGPSVTFETLELLRSVGSGPMVGQRMATDGNSRGFARPGPRQGNLVLQPELSPPTLFRPTPRWPDPLAPAEDLRAQIRTPRVGAWRSILALHPPTTTTTSATGTLPERGGGGG